MISSEILNIHYTLLSNIVIISSYFLEIPIIVKWFTQLHRYACALTTQLDLTNNNTVKRGNHDEVRVRAATSSEMPFHRDRRQRWRYPHPNQTKFKPSASCLANPRNHTWVTLWDFDLDRTLTDFSMSQLPSTF